MGIFLSPGVYTKEKDLSEIIPNISSTSAALVGYSAKGTLDLKTITNSQQFINEYGKPVPGNYFHYSALAFLENGNVLYCKRVTNGALYGGMSVVDSNSSDDNAAFSVGQTSAVFYDDSAVVDEIFSVFGKDPGIWNDKISIIVKDVNDLYYDSDGIHSAEETDQYTLTVDV